MKALCSSMHIGAGKSRLTGEGCVGCSAFDLENKVVGTVGAGRIGQRVLQRLKVRRLAC